LGDSLSITVSGAYTYVWTPNSNIVSNTGSTVLVYPPSTTNYLVTATDTNGCMDTASTTVVVNQLPNISVTPAIDSICEGSSSFMVASGGLNYQWLPINSLQSPTGSTNIATPNNTTIYTIIGSDINNCSNIATSIVHVIEPPNIIVSPKNGGICSGDSILLTVTSDQTIVNYIWSNGKTTNPIYASPIASVSIGVSAFNYFGCYDSDTSTIIVTNTPIISLNATSPICLNSSSEINITSSAQLPYQINFDLDNGNMISGNGNGPYNVEWPTIGVKNIELVIIKNGCSSEAAFDTIVVNESPTANFIIQNGATCEDIPLFFQNLSNDTSLNTIWHFGDVFTDDDTSATYNSSHTYSSPGTYNIKLVVENIFGCKDSLNLSSGLNIYPTPVADFSFHPEQISIIDPVVNFSDMSNVGYYWNWDFGDMYNINFNTSTEKNPQHIYSDTGAYVVCMKVASVHGCIDSICKGLEIGYPPKIIAPTAFTPNGDNINDFFFIKGDNYDWSTFEIYIYNRWGELVYESRDRLEGWDGTHKNTGEKAPDAMYSFFIRVKDHNGKTHKLVKSLMLYR